MFNSPMDAMGKVFCEGPGSVTKWRNFSVQRSVWNFLRTTKNYSSTSLTPNHLGVSKNRCTPKSSIFIGFSLINHPFWCTPIFGNIHFKTFSKLLWSQPIPFRQSIAEDQLESVDRWCRARKPKRISETFTVFSVPFFWGTPPKTNLAMENEPFEDIWTLSKKV